ncbi:unnamed protein product [Cochlearia groenlandica]
MSTVVISKNQTRDRNLVDSTKLERIALDSKTLRRNENKEKKERRKLKKEKKKLTHSSKLVTTKIVSDDSDQLEKSGLTEELEETHNNLGYLSDGSQTSKKRRRVDSTPPPPVVQSSVKAVHVGGNPLRIRLIFKKPKVDDSPSLPQEDLPVCSTSGAETLVLKESVVLSSVPCVKVSLPEANVLSASVAETKKIKKHKPSREDIYNALFDHWTPLSSISVLAKEADSYSNEDADDWLFGNKRQEKPRESVKIDEDSNMCSSGTSDSSWPRARFLPEVGIYSLPYTVPF